MVQIYERQEKELVSVAAATREKFWVNLISPTHTELQQVAEQYDLPLDLLTAALDPDERPRIEAEDGCLLILLRIPITASKEDENVPYITRPLGILFTQNLIFTVCTRESSVIADFVHTKVKHFNPENRRRFLLQIFYRTTLKYLRFLREMQAQTDDIEAELITSSNNAEVLRLLNYEKSLVFFTTALRANHAMMERLRKTKMIQTADEDTQEYLEDILIDNLQAVEMAKVYADILESIMGALNSVINNNLNTVIKSLTKITIILMLPTLVASFFGMNVNLPFQDSPYAFLVVLGVCLVLVAAGYAIFSIRRLF